ncbi:MAG: hypothetical protein ABIA93_00135 [Candidatus Woesearchaeota archaeon]
MIVAKERLERITPKSIANVTDRGYDTQWIHDPQKAPRAIAPAMLSVLKSIRQVERREDLTMLDFRFGPPLLLNDTVRYEATMQSGEKFAELHAIGPAGDNLQNGKQSTAWIGPQHMATNGTDCEELDVSTDPIMHKRIARILHSPPIEHGIHALVLGSKVLLMKMEYPSTDLEREILESRDNPDYTKRKTPIYMAINVGLIHDQRRAVFTPGESVRYSITAKQSDSRLAEYAVNCEGPHGQIMSATYIVGKASESLIYRFMRRKTSKLK